MTSVHDHSDHSDHSDTHDMSHEHSTDHSEHMTPAHNPQNMAMATTIITWIMIILWITKVP
jgi:hypothetical protein